MVQLHFSVVGGQRRDRDDILARIDQVHLVASLLA
jgi:hypothetical protein